MDSPMRRARKTAGLSTTEAGRRAGISGAAVTMFETGQRSMSLDTLHRYAEAVGMTDLAAALGPVVSFRQACTKTAE